MDNFSINLTAEGKASLVDAMRIAFRHNAWSGKTGFWCLKTPKEGPCAKQTVLVFIHDVSDKTAKEDGWCRFPVSMGPEQAADTAWSWLEAQDYGREPDHDGENHKGWRVYCDFWGHVDGEHYAIVGVCPNWAMYGK